MEFFVENLSIIICIVVGIGLLIVEMFMPGFGIPGISGLALLAASIYFTWTMHGMMAALFLALAELVIVGLTIWLSLRSASKGKLSKSPLILKGSQSQAEGFVATDEYNRYLGKTGVTTTVLRPAGIADFDGERINVVSEGEFIAKGASVIVREVEGARVMVEEADNNV